MVSGELLLGKLDNIASNPGFLRLSPKVNFPVLPAHWTA